MKASGGLADLKSPHMGGCIGGGEGGQRSAAKEKAPPERSLETTFSLPVLSEQVFEVFEVVCWWCCKHQESILAKGCQTVAGALAPNEALLA